MFRLSRLCRLTLVDVMPIDYNLLARTVAATCNRSAPPNSIAPSPVAPTEHRSYAPTFPDPVSPQPHPAFKSVQVALTAAEGPESGINSAAFEQTTEMTQHKSAPADWLPEHISSFGTSFMRNITGSDMGRTGTSEAMLELVTRYTRDCVGIVGLLRVKAASRISGEEGSEYSASEHQNDSGQLLMVVSTHLYWSVPGQC